MLEEPKARINQTSIRCLWFLATSNFNNIMNSKVLITILHYFIWIEYPQSPWDENNEFCVQDKVEEEKIQNKTNMCWRVRFR